MNFESELRQLRQLQAENEKLRLQVSIVHVLSVHKPYTHGIIAKHLLKILDKTHN